jgi:hypothetical protein
LTAAERAALAAATLTIARRSYRSGGVTVPARLAARTMGSRNLFTCHRCQPAD